MESVPYSHIAKGTLLIASPDIRSGVFFRAVILLCEHNNSGSFGIVINKQLDLELPEEILNPEQLNNEHVGMRAGGPVRTNQMMVLHNSKEINDPEHTLKICDAVYLGGDLRFLQTALSEEKGPDVRLCFGYSGWGEGQLESEFLEGGWFLCPATTNLVFDTPVEKIWQTTLRQMGGKYASLSMIPEDLSLN